MKHFKYRKFANEANKNKVSDQNLNDALNEFLGLDEKGRQKFSLGAGLYKIRLATVQGRGKSAGSRSIMAFKDNNRIIWLHLFSKNEKGNITTSELKKLKILSGVLLNLSSKEIKSLIISGELSEVICNE